MNRVEIKGVAYIAAKSPAGTCAGCAGATLPGQPTNPLCIELPRCGSGVREDGRNVVWIREATE